MTVIQTKDPGFVPLILPLIAAEGDLTVSLNHLMPVLPRGRVSSERLSMLSKVTKLETGKGSKSSVHVFTILWLGQGRCNYMMTLHPGEVFTEQLQPGIHGPAREAALLPF